MDVDGGIAMGQVTTGTAVFKAGRSINDNNSMLNVSDLTLRRVEISELKESLST